MLKLLILKVLSCQNVIKNENMELDILQNSQKP